MFKVPEPPVLKPNQKIRTVVLDRKGRKKMTNPGKVVDVIKQTELAKFDFLPETSKQVRGRAWVGLGLDINGGSPCARAPVPCSPCFSRKAHRSRRRSRSCGTPMCWWVFTAPG